MKNISDFKIPDGTNQTLLNIFKAFCVGIVFISSLWSINQLYNYLKPEPCDKVIATFYVDNPEKIFGASLKIDVTYAWYVDNVIFQDEIKFRVPNATYKFSDYDVIKTNKIDSIHFKMCRCLNMSNEELSRLEIPLKRL